MKKSLLTSFVACLFSIGAIAQTCTGDFEFNSQAEVDAFLTENLTCTGIDGRVTINSSDLNPISNLGGLQNLTHITGDLIITSTADPSSSSLSLTGLSNLSSIGGTLNLQDLTGQITSLVGLENLTSLGALNFEAYYGISDLSPLNNLVQVSDISLGQSNNVDLINIFPSLTTLNSLTINPYSPINNTFSITGFSNVTNCNSISIYNSGNGEVNLNNLEIFNALTHCETISLFGIIANSFHCFEQIQQCPNFQVDVIGGTNFQFLELSSAENVGIFGGTANSIINFPLLTNLTALNIVGDFDHINFPLLSNVGSLSLIGNTDPSWQNPVSIHDAYFPSIVNANSIEIRSTNMSDLMFLNSLESVSGAFTVRLNPYLSECGIHYFCLNLNLDYSQVLIENNNTGCNALEEVVFPCGQNQISGSIYADANCNGVLDQGEPGIPEQLLLSNGSAFPGLYSFDGSFFLTPDGNQNLDLTTTTINGFTSPQSQQFSLGSDPVSFENVNFGMCPTQSGNDASISLMSMGPIAPNHPTTVIVTITNEYLGVNNGSVNISIPSSLTFGDNPGISITDNTASWNFSGLAPFESSSWTIHLSGTENIIVGSLVSIGGQVSITDDFNLANNQASTGRRAVAAFDPNMIEVNQENINIADATLNTPIDLEYTIHFQNTGSIDATDVILHDQIDSDLDLSTLDIVASSHNCQLEVGLNNNVSFLFNNIHLADSASDLAGSMGFVQYRIRTQSNWNISTEYVANASIVFDTNAPITTNTALTSFYECTQNLGLTTSESEVCQGESVSANIGGTWDTLLWTVNGESVVAENSYVLNNVMPGIYSIQALASAGFCWTQGNIEVLVHANPSAPTINLTSPNMLEATGGTSYAWTFNGTPINTNTPTLAITESGDYSVIAINEFGCESAATSGSFVYTNTEEHSNSSLVLYPNPAKSNLFVELSNSPTQLTITDMTGRMVYNMQQCLGRQSISLTGWAKGVYTLNVISSNGSERKQFVVE